MPDDKPRDLSLEAWYSRLGEVQRRLDGLSTEELDKSRRDLLIASTIGLVVSVTGAVPTKIEAIGVEFTRIEQRYFFIFIALVVSYFVTKMYLKYKQHNFRFAELYEEELSLLHRIGEEKEKGHGFLGLFFYRLQMGTEFWLPICLGILSIAVSFYAAIVGQSVAQQGMPLPSPSSPNS